jgi:hypothetical protein
MNGQINKCFAHGVVSWLKHGTKFDWAKCVAYCDKYNVELREMKMANLAWQAESGVVGAVKCAPQPSSYRHLKPMSETTHGQTLQSNKCQILTKLETNKSVKVLGSKWDVEEIQICKDFLQGKCLMLGGVKNTIVVASTKNDEIIATERRFSIKSKDFRIVHAKVVYQLALVKDLLKKTIILKN